MGLKTPMHNPAHCLVRRYETHPDHKGRSAWQGDNWGSTRARVCLSCADHVGGTVLPYFTAHNNKAQSHPATAGIVRLHLLSEVLSRCADTIIRASYTFLLYYAR